MNAFDYFFENTYDLNKNFIVGKQELSFKELFKKSFSLSGFIKKRVGENQNIILISPNNSFFLIVYLAIIKSGNTCIPLDPMIEPDNYKYISDLTDPSLLFITKEVQRRLLINKIENIITDILDFKDQPFNGESDIDFNENRCAEIIFTSGSTGIPKGVMISHKNLIANTRSILQYLKIEESDRILVVLPFYYCYGLSLLHTHLRAGASLVFNNSFIFLGAVINDLKNYSCTGFAGVPSHFQILLRKSESFKKTEFPDLKYVTQAGGKLATAFIDEFREAFPEVRFIVMYGQTEATARLSYLSPELYESKKGSIGKAIPGVQLKVVNSQSNEIQPGETGEVIAKGENIMLGYYKDSESTESTLRNGWLHTGDLGTVDKDGFIYLTTRMKEIIKVGGKRISPKEIEAVILELPQIIDCTIEAVKDELQGEALLAKIVINRNKPGSFDEERIKKHCSGKLALYKIPQKFEFIEQLTMSATGKKIKGKL